MPQKRQKLDFPGSGIGGGKPFELPQRQFEPPTRDFAPPIRQGGFQQTPKPQGPITYQRPNPITPITQLPAPVFKPYTGDNQSIREIDNLAQKTVKVIEDMEQSVQSRLLSIFTRFKRAISCVTEGMKKVQGPDPPA